MTAINNCQDFERNVFGNHFVSHGYDQVSGMMASKYGLDLDALKNATPEQIAIMKDAAERSAWLIKNFELIEDMIGDIIDGQVTWTELQARLVQRGAKGAEKIEKATGNMMIARLRWEAQIKKQGVRMNEETTIIDDDVANFTTLSQHQITTTLQIQASELANKMADISGAPARAVTAKADAEERKSLEEKYHRALNFGSFQPTSKEPDNSWQSNRVGHAIDVPSRVVSSGSGFGLSLPRGSPQKALAAGIGGVITFGASLKNGIGKINKWMQGGSG